MPGERRQQCAYECAGYMDYCLMMAADLRRPAPDLSVFAQVQPTLKMFSFLSCGVTDQIKSAGRHPVTISIWNSSIIFLTEGETRSDLFTPTNKMSPKPTDGWELVSCFRFSGDQQLSVSVTTLGLIYQTGYLPCTVNLHV